MRPIWCSNTVCPSISTFVAQRYSRLLCTCGVARVGVIVAASWLPLTLSWKPVSQSTSRVPT